MLSFALKTLLYDRAKLLIALVGVPFSLVLVNVQGGLFLGMIRKASVIIDNCDADIWVGHRGVQNSDITAEIPEAWLNRISGLPGVVRAEPYIVAASTMKLPTVFTSTSGGRLAVQPLISTETAQSQITATVALPHAKAISFLSGEGK